jgi:hypothetical protein
MTPESLRLGGGGCHFFSRAARRHHFTSTSTFAGNSLFPGAKHYGCLLKESLFDAFHKYKKAIFVGIGLMILDTEGLNLVLIYSRSKCAIAAPRRQSISRSRFSAAPYPFSASPLCMTRNGRCLRCEPGLSRFSRPSHKGANGFISLLHEAD